MRPDQVPQPGHGACSAVLVIVPAVMVMAGLVLVPAVAPVLMTVVVAGRLVLVARVRH
jgi:hypothetical protein